MNPLNRKIHRLLDRQFKKHLADSGIDILKLQNFLYAINDAYYHFDEDYQQLQRTLELSSNELFKANEKLETTKADLEKKVEERTMALQVTNRVMLDEIKERQKAETELKRAIEKATSATDAKASFLSNMSHEIRTPMHAIVGLTDLLLEEDLTEHQREKIESIKFASENLKVLIDDILDFSKIEAGKLRFEHIRFSMRALISNVNKMAGFKAREKGLPIEIIIDPDLPDYFTGDPTRVQQVLSNLLSNAVKFTEEGKIVIRIDIISRNKGNVHMKISVSDTGIGIPEEKQKDIFETFTQAQESITRKFGGTGLGLSISKKIVEMMGGSIEVKSNFGKGSEFIISLELPLAEEEDPTGKQTGGGAEAGLDQLKVLLVEDNKINQFVACQILKKWDINVQTADNGNIALEILKNNKFHLVLMDLQMPERNGIDTAVEIRNPQSSVLQHDIPIVALTADAFAATRIKVLEYGMNDYIAKPFTQDELLQIIKKNVMVSPE